MRGRFSMPMRNTSVPLRRATCPQGMAETPLPSRSWPVITVNDEAASRCVTGMPAYAGAAMADVTPGTTS